MIRMKLNIRRIAPFILLSGITCTVFAGLEAGEQINLTIRGIAADEQQKINGPYRVGESGNVRLPMLEQLVNARGLTPEQFARAAEAAYKTAGIYSHPAIEIEVIKGKNIDEVTVISVGGQAIDGAGGQNDFGGRNLFLYRDGKQYCLDFTNLAHKNIILRPGDSIQVEQKGVIDRWKGKDEAVKKLME